MAQKNMYQRKKFIKMQSLMTRSAKEWNGKWIEMHNRTMKIKGNCHFFLSHIKINGNKIWCKQIAWQLRLFGKGIKKTNKRRGIKRIMMMIEQTDIRIKLEMEDLFEVWKSEKKLHRCKQSQENTSLHKYCRFLCAFFCCISVVYVIISITRLEGIVRIGRRMKEKYWSSLGDVVATIHSFHKFHFTIIKRRLKFITT